MFEYRADGTTYWTAAVTEAERKSLQLESEHHSLLHKFERLFYYGIRAQARQTVWAPIILSAAFDGSTGFDFPWRREGSKISKEARKQKVHVMLSALLRHLPTKNDAVQCDTQLFLTFGKMFKHDRNQTCSALCLYLFSVLSQRDHKGLLAGVPPIFALRTDSGSEQKNGIFLIFLGILVFVGLFKHVVWSQGLAGHTHDDVDGRFGNIMNAMKARQIMFPAMGKLTEILAGIGASGGGPWSAHDMNGVFDFITWLKPFCQKALSGISKMHVFWIYKESDTVFVRYKPRTSFQGSWSAPMGLLTQIPPGEPRAVIPDMTTFQMARDSIRASRIPADDQVLYDELFTTPPRPGRCYYSEILQPFLMGTPYPRPPGWRDKDINEFLAFHFEGSMPLSAIETASRLVINKTPVCTLSEVI